MLSTRFESCQEKNDYTGRQLRGSGKQRELEDQRPVKMLCSILVSIMDATASLTLDAFGEPGLGSHKSVQALYNTAADGMT